MSFADLPGQQLSGPIGVAADFSGRVQSPQLTGIVRANNLTFVHETYGTRITKLALQGRFTSSRAPDRPAVRPRRRRHDRGQRHDRLRLGGRLSDRHPPQARQGPARPQRQYRRDPDRQPAIINNAQRRADLRRARPRRGALPDHPPGRGPGVELAGVRRKGEPLPTPGEPSRPTPAAEHLEARPPPARRQPRLHRRHGPRIRMARRPARPGHDRDAADRRQGGPDPRHLSFSGRRFTSPAAMSPSPATGRPIRASTSSPAPTSRTSPSTSTSRAAPTTRRSPSPPRRACRRTRSSRGSCSAAR